MRIRPRGSEGIPRRIDDGDGGAAAPENGQLRPSRPARRDHISQDVIELITRRVRLTPEVMLKVLSRGGQDLDGQDRAASSVGQIDWTASGTTPRGQTCSSARHRPCSLDMHSLPMHGVPWSRLAIESPRDRLSARLEWSRKDLLYIFPFVLSAPPPLERGISKIHLHMALRFYRDDCGDRAMLPRL